LFAIIATYSWNTFINFYLANKEKKQIKGAFSSYVAPSIVDQMLANPEMLKVGGEKKNITIFFSDVRDFTTISESLTPTELSTCLNKYMGIMTDLLFDNEGTLDKYIGDAIVAYWGAPVDVENHALKAVLTSIKMIEVLPSINDGFRELGYPEFRHGIGLNTGDCSVGNMGSDKIFSYTALGDSMNLGARLESLCKFYGVQLNVSEFTIAALPPEERKKLKYRILDKVRVKGKSEPVTMYEVYHSFHHLMTDTKSHDDYMIAFECYQNMDFQQAINLLKPIVDKYPIEDGKPLEKASRHVLERCITYLANPPEENWDGVFTHTTKG
jgi:adenylate cyclase